MGELEAFGENVAHDPVGHAQYDGHEEGGYDAGAHCGEWKRLGTDEGSEGIEEEEEEEEEEDDGRQGIGTFICARVLPTLMLREWCDVEKEALGA